MKLNICKNVMTAALASNFYYYYDMRFMQMLILAFMCYA